jgi:hypothetical protein
VILTVLIRLLRPYVGTWAVASGSAPISSLIFSEWDADRGAILLRYERADQAPPG